MFPQTIVHVLVEIIPTTFNLCGFKGYYAQINQEHLVKELVKLCTKQDVQNSIGLVAFCRSYTVIFGGHISFPLYPLCT